MQRKRRRKKRKKRILKSCREVSMTRMIPGKRI